ncbi:hypothetical protein SISNIDRAFT_485483 [Sistotremastrum niveocremeum HHB9708]|uniref:Uncharacterized protein n=1 Tax=Sistotremastrum niveocremeum HHB9708 TaxID=1314777 RepID=A0A164V7F3_9AGAM|nr:hypothetical protein SISNIDRAFT_485483 [Sistotremastrum niveocremeum HHB9708]
MGRARWTTPDQEKFLASKINEYIDVHRTPAYTEFEKVVLDEYFDQWPAKDAKFSSQNAYVGSEADVEAELTRRMKSRIREWFRSRTKEVTNAAAKRSLWFTVKAEAHKTLPAWQAYLALRYEDKLAPIVERHLKEYQEKNGHPLPPNMLMNFKNQVAMAEFEKETDEVKAEVEAVRFKRQAEGVRKRKKKQEEEENRYLPANIEDLAEDEQLRLRAAARLQEGADLLRINTEAYLDLVEHRTGFMACYRRRSFSQERRENDRNVGDDPKIFSEFHPDWKTAVQGELSKFLLACFPPDVCAERSLVVRPGTEKTAQSSSSSAEPQADNADLLAHEAEAEAHRLPAVEAGLSQGSAPIPASTEPTSTSTSESHATVSALVSSLTQTIGNTLASASVGAAPTSTQAAPTSPSPLNAPAASIPRCMPKLIDPEDDDDESRDDPQAEMEVAPSPAHTQSLTRSLSSVYPSTQVPRARTPLTPSPPSTPASATTDSEPTAPVAPVVPVSVPAIGITAPPPSLASSSPTTSPSPVTTSEAADKSSPAALGDKPSPSLPVGDREESPATSSVTPSETSTSSVSPSTTSSTSVENDSFPLDVLPTDSKYIAPAMAFLLARLSSDLDKRMIGLWLAIERYTENRDFGKIYASAEFRPNSLSQWVKSGRKYNYPPKLEPNFGTLLRSYLMALYPTWRQPPSDEGQPPSNDWPPPRNLPDNEKWETILKSSHNGLYMIVLSFACWRVSPSFDNNVYVSTLEDFVWVLESIYRKFDIRNNTTSPASATTVPSKRRSNGATSEKRAKR